MAIGHFITQAATRGLIFGIIAASVYEFRLTTIPISFSHWPSLIVLFLIGGGGWLATRQLYFLGTDGQGVVTIYRGLPYDLPAGIKLYETYYVSGLPATLVPTDRRAQLFVRGSVEAAFREVRVERRLQATRHGFGRHEGDALRDDVLAFGRSNRRAALASRGHRHDAPLR